MEPGDDDDVFELDEDEAYFYDGEEDTGSAERTRVLKGIESQIQSIVDAVAASRLPSKDAAEKLVVLASELNAADHRLNHEETEAYELARERVAYGFRIAMAWAPIHDVPVVAAAARRTGQSGLQPLFARRIEDSLQSEYRPKTLEQLARAARDVGGEDSDLARRLEDRAAKVRTYADAADHGRDTDEEHTQRVLAKSRSARLRAALPTLVKARLGGRCRDVCGPNTHGIVVTYVEAATGVLRCGCFAAEDLYRHLVGDKELLVSNGRWSMVPLQLPAAQVTRVTKKLLARCFPLKRGGGAAAAPEPLFGPRDAGPWVEGVAVVVPGLRTDVMVPISSPLDLPVHPFPIMGVEVHSAHTVIYRPWATGEMMRVQIALVTNGMGYSDGVRYLALSHQGALQLGIGIGDLVRWRNMRPPAATKVWVTGDLAPDTAPAAIAAHIGPVPMVYRGMNVDGVVIHRMEPACIGTLPRNGPSSVEFEVVPRSVVEAEEEAELAGRQAIAVRYRAKEDQQRKAAQMAALARAGVVAGAGSGAGADAEVDADTEECPICMEPVVDGVDVVRLPCGHRLHYDCFRGLCTHANRSVVPCPSCRAPATCS